MLPCDENDDPADCDDAYNGDGSAYDWDDDEWEEWVSYPNDLDLCEED